MTSTGSIGITIHQHLLLLDITITVGLILLHHKIFVALLVCHVTYVVKRAGRHDTKEHIGK